MSTGRKERVPTFAERAAAQLTGDERGHAQIFVDRLFQACSQRRLREVGRKPKFCIGKANEDGSGTAFADYFWKPLVHIEMRRRAAENVT